jgi:hypothetical protein
MLAVGDGHANLGSIVRFVGARRRPDRLSFPVCAVEVIDVYVPPEYGSPALSP